MKRPDNLFTKIFLDGGDPVETKQLIENIGFLDGQTTNPTLISKNPEAAKKIAEGGNFTNTEIMDFYKKIVSDISGLIPEGSVSIEVYSDLETQAEEMIKQGMEMNTWIPNAHIKLPTTQQGLKAANELVKRGIRVNMTLVFNQSQAAAVYSATRGAVRGQVYLSPFIGRLDDKGQNGMDLIKNILKMYKSGDGHVEVLTASVRNMNHLLGALVLNSDIITAPFKLINEWSESGKPVPEKSFEYDKGNLEPIEYKEFDLNQDWSSFDINDDLTKTGIQKFASDWNSLIKS